jgi:cytochrome c oxidase subunit 2
MVPLMRLAQFTLFGLFTASSSAVNAASQINLTEGVTPVSHDIYDLHMTVFWVCVVIGILVFGVMIYSILYHRKSLGVKPAQFHEHLWVELTWTIIPFLILVLLAIPGTRVLLHMNDTAQPDLTIKVTGYQWKWRYEYLDNGIQFFSNISTPLAERQGLAPKGENYLREVDHPLVLPIHKKIRFLVTATDVIHAWWVPDFGVKRDAVPGFISEVWARINRPGIYHGQCAELCGINHAFMPIVVIALPEKAFDAWVAQQKGLLLPAAPVTPAVPARPGTKPPPAPAAQKIALADLMKQGEHVYQSACAVCHKPDGTGSPPVFPALKGSKIVAGPVIAHIAIVLHGKLGTAMQAFDNQLNDKDLAAVITYERNTFGNNTGATVQPDDITAAKTKKE